MYAPGNMGNESAAPTSDTDAWHPIVDPLGSDFTSNAVPAVMKGKDPQCVRFGFPKGSLQKSTEELFARAGLPVKVKDRNYFPTVEDDGLSLVLFRSQEIPRYVADGVLDAGICGRDWIVENGSDVVEVAELKYSKATSNPASSAWRRAFSKPAAGANATEISAFSPGAIVPAGGSSVKHPRVNAAPSVLGGFGTSPFSSRSSSDSDRAP